LYELRGYSPTSAPRPPSKIWEGERTGEEKGGKGLGKKSRGGKGREGMGEERKRRKGTYGREDQTPPKQKYSGYSLVI